MIIINVIYLAIYMFYSLTGVNTKNVTISRRSEVSGEKFADVEPMLNEHTPSSKCWLSLNAWKHFQLMDNLDNRYSKVRNEYQDELGGDFDKKMLETLLNTRGIALRDVHKAGGDPSLIPAGLNLGGYCMMKMMDSVLFFHRMKLRNNTRFRVNYLHNDLVNMVRTVRLSLHDLHLLGAYERSPTDKDPSVLFYAPSYGQVEFLLKNVNYKMEGRLRLLKDRLIIELVISEIIIEDILMMYINNGVPESPIRLQKQNIADAAAALASSYSYANTISSSLRDTGMIFRENRGNGINYEVHQWKDYKNMVIEDFIDRLKTDLDLWLKDYFNDYNMLFFGLRNIPNDQFQQAEKQKAIALNEYADYAISVLKHKIRQIGAQSATIPHFTIFSANKMQLKLQDGVIRGLDSMYRRSVATGKKEGSIRKVDLIVGFSSLKVEYKYEAILSTDVPPLTGVLILSADELTAHMGLYLVKDPESVDLEFNFLQQMKPESLTVEGPANRMISNFKHLLEHHIIAIMSSTLVHNVKMLRTLTRCEPSLVGESKSTNQAAGIESMSKVKYDDSLQKDYNGQHNDKDSKEINANGNNSNGTLEVNDSTFSNQAAGIEGISKGDDFSQKDYNDQHNDKDSKEINANDNNSNETLEVNDSTFSNQAAGIEGISKGDDFSQKDYNDQHNDKDSKEINANDNNSNETLEVNDSTFSNQAAGIEGISKGDDFSQKDYNEQHNDNDNQEINAIVNNSNETLEVNDSSSSNQAAGIEGISKGDDFSQNDYNEQHNDKDSKEINASVNNSNETLEIRDSSSRNQAAGIEGISKGDDSSQKDYDEQHNDNDNQEINANGNNSNEEIKDQPNSRDAEETITNDDITNEDEIDQLIPSERDQNANQVDEDQLDKLSDSNDEKVHANVEEFIRGRPERIFEKNNSLGLSGQRPKTYVKNGDIVKLKHNEELKKARVKPQ